MALHGDDGGNMPNDVDGHFDTGDAADTSASTLRLRIALIIFFVLIIAGGAALMTYFWTGRSWIVAATVVDDSVGELDDYSVILFSGTSEPEAEKPSTDPSDQKATQGDSDAGGNTNISDVLSDNEYKATSISDLINSAYQLADKRSESDKERVFVSDVRDLYELRGAKALTLNVANPEIYSEPTTLHAGNKTIGIFSVSAYASRSEMKKLIGGVKEDDPDIIICIAPRRAFLSTLDDVDVAIFTDESVDYYQPNPRDDSLIVFAPEIGDTGVILISSNNVATFKVVEEL